MLTDPLDTVRRRMEMMSLRSVDPYESSLDCARRILANEGLKSLFKGASANVTRGVTGAIVLVAFD